mgnify:CR=1 FL=1
MSLMINFWFFDITNRCRLTQWLIDINAVYRNSDFLYNKNFENSLKICEITKTPANGLFTLLVNSYY